MPDIVVVCGLSREAALAGAGVRAIAGGGDRPALERRLAAIERPSAVISFGLAGALHPALPVGAVVVPADVVDESGRGYAVASHVREAWHRLLEVADTQRATRLVAVDAPAMDVASKLALRGRTGADVVDMESHVAGAYAERVGAPFAVLRVVSDAAHRSLPPVAALAMQPGGAIDVRAVLLGLARAPGQIPALVATARDAAAAFRALRRVRRLLGPGFGLQL